MGLCFLLPPGRHRRPHPLGILATITSSRGAGYLKPSYRMMASPADPGEKVTAVAVGRRNCEQKIIAVIESALPEFPISQRFLRLVAGGGQPSGLVGGPHRTKSMPRQPKIC
jgi:hypothetical protein